MRSYIVKMKAKDICPPRKPAKKILWSWLGSFLGIYGIATLSQLLSANEIDGLFLIGSFGASAVLVYGAPLAEFSQPRNVIGGHVVSALIGVTVFLVIGDSLIWASAMAVSLSIAAMHLTRSMHPPGGATALIAIIGTEKIHDMGYWYALNPVLGGAVIMVLIALLVNNLSSNPKRHYPVYWY